MPRASPTGWPRQRLRQAGLVERVAGLVQHAHQRRDELVLAVAGGDADVGGRAAAERVRALVEPAGIEVEAEPGHQRSAELLLPRRRERPGWAAAGRAACRASTASSSGGSSAARRSNSAHDLGRRADRAGARRAGRRRATGRARRRSTDAVSRDKPDDLGQLRRQHREIGLGARLAPESSRRWWWRAPAPRPGPARGHGRGDSGAASRADWPCCQGSRSASSSAPASCSPVSACGQELVRDPLEDRELLAAIVSGLAAA